MPSNDEPRADQEPEIPVDAPEADVLEQRTPAVPADVDDVPDTIPVDAPEADVLEQSKSVPREDEPGG